MNTTNSNITLNGEPLPVLGQALKVGDRLPAFKLTGLDMGDLSYEKFAGKPLVISVVPSLDTPTCSIQTKRFNQELGGLSKDINILTVSMDLPFAQKRWCGAEGVEKLTLGSDYKYHSFGEAFGVLISSLGLLARAVFVVDARGIIQHVEYVQNLAAEPDYQAALKVAA